MFLTVKLRTYLRLTELFEMELFICTKINLVLNDLQRLICHKPKQTNKFDIIELLSSYWYYIGILDAI